MRRRTGKIVSPWAMALTLAVLPATVRADDPPTRASIEANYRAALARAEKEHIQALAALAASQKPDQADATYLDLFRLAVGTDQYLAAEPAADRVLGARATVETELTVLAKLVKIIAEADRGDLDGSMRDARAALTAGQTRHAPAVQTRTRLAIAEAYFRRLLRGGRFEAAAKLCDMAVAATDDPAVREHFTAYRRRLEMVGKPAPELAGSDADGKPVTLADTKGKVVLVVFWASWCPPCVEGAPLVTQAYRKYAKDGFAVFGVNLDTGPDRAAAVRRFVVEHALPWPNLLAGEADVASAYGVKEIPASVLVGRDGKVLTFDVPRDDLLDTVGKALGQSSPK